MPPALILLRATRGPLPPCARAGDLAKTALQSGSTTAAPQPASLPNLWLHRLATHVSAQALEDDDDTPARRTVLALFRTCTACRDAVLLSRQANVFASVPITQSTWPGVLERLCTALRRSRKVWLGVQGPSDAWTQTEPYIILLLLCVRGKLGAAALEGVKAVHLRVSGWCLEWGQERLLRPSSTARP